MSFKIIHPAYFITWKCLASHAIRIKSRTIASLPDVLLNLKTVGGDVLDLADAVLGDVLESVAVVVQDLALLLCCSLAAKLLLIITFLKWLFWKAFLKSSIF